MNIRWSTTARDDLAKLWLKADSAQRTVISAAALEIDQRLQKNAEDEGESRPDGRRILFQRPLGILFRIDATRTTVQVSTIWKFR